MGRIDAARGEEEEALMPPSDLDATSSTSASSSSSSTKKILIRGFLLITLLGCFLLYLNDEESKGEFGGNGKDNDDEGIITMTEDGKVRRKIPLKMCDSFCSARLQQRLSHHHGKDYRQTEQLLDLVQQNYEVLQNRLKDQYGKEYFQKMFYKNENDKTFRGGISSPHGNISEERFRRKLQMKILQMQSNIYSENKNFEGCQCQKNEPTQFQLNVANGEGKDGERKATSKDSNIGTSSVTKKKSKRREMREAEDMDHGNNEQQQQQQQQQRRLRQVNITLPPVLEHYTQFIWTTAGHSAAAGHGNLFNESYTAFFERAAKPIFDSIGISFQARNYAMGGMRSGPELALCQEAVYGIDSDMITWDFGMTDAGKEHNKNLFAHRIGVHQNRPATMYIRIDGYEKDAYLAPLEEQGLTTFYMEPNVVSDIQKHVPDMLGMSQNEINQVPEFLRYYKCSKKIEKGEPGCEKLKYNDAICPDRMHKAPWHPGWKVNAVYGNIMAMWLIESLQDALKDLGTVEDPIAKLEELKRLEQKDYDTFLKSKFPEDPINQLMPDKEKMEGDVKPSLIHRSRAICHTALLPSDIRYKGILTETRSSVGPDLYAKGISQEEANKNPTQDGSMRIVVEEKERQSWCPVQLKADFKDFFYTTDKDGTTSLKFPNQRELAEYNSQKDFKPKGVLVICFILCDWDKCPDGEMQYKEFNEKKFSLKVNGKKVSELVSLDLCAILKHEDGYNWEPDERGQYEISAKVKKQSDDKTSYIRITSLILM